MSDAAEIKLVLDDAEARKKLDRFRDELKQTGATAAEASQASSGALGGFGRSLAQAGFAGGLGALATPGGGAQDALIGSMNNLAQIMQVEGGKIAAAGAISGDLVGAAQGAGQAAIGALIKRNLEPIARARESAIAQVSALTGREAQLGQPVNDQLIQAFFTQIFAQEKARFDNDARVRRVSNFAGGF